MFEMTAAFCKWVLQGEAEGREFCPVGGVLWLPLLEVLNLLFNLISFDGGEE